MKSLEDLINEAADEVVDADMELNTIDERLEAFEVLVDMIDPDLDDDVKADIMRQMREIELKRLH